MIAAVSILFFCAAAVYIAFGAPNRWLLNPVPLFVCGQIVMFAGSVPLLDASIGADRVHAWVMLWGLVGFVAGAASLDYLLRTQRRALAWREQPVIVEESGFFLVMVVALAGLSVLVMVAFYAAAGVNVFVESLVSFVRSGERLENVVEIRRGFSSGSRYLAPGYVNQFKNIILPLLTLYFALRYRLRRRPSDRVIAIVLLPLAVAGLLGTGQRGAFVEIVIIAVIFGWAVLPPRVGMRYATRWLLGGLTLFALATFFLGRGAVATRLAVDNSVVVTLAEIWERAFWGNQASAVAGFRYVYSQEPVWGQDWLAGALSMVPRNLFPNKPQSTLGLDVFEILYSSRGGVAPVSLWGSAWYNFGALGVILVPVVLGALYQWLYARMLRRTKWLGQLAVSAGLTVVLGLWLAGGPEAPLNRGLLTLAILSVLMRLRWRSALDAAAARTLGGTGASIDGAAAVGSRP